MDPVTKAERELEESGIAVIEDSTPAADLMPDELLSMDEDDRRGEPEEASAPATEERHTASQILEHVHVDTTDPTNILMIIGAVIMLGVGGAWWYLSEEEELPDNIVPITRPLPTWTVGRLPTGVSPDDAASEEAPQSQADALLERARMAANAGLLIEPQGVSALDYYRAVLDEDPQNVEAGEGAARIVQAVLDDAETAATAGRTENAIATLNWIKTFQPGNPRIADIENVLRERQTEQVQIATRLIGQGEFATAEARLDALAAAPYADSTAIQSARQRLASARAGAVAKARTDARQQQQLARRARIEAIIDDYKASVADGHLVAAEDNSAQLHLDRLKKIDADNPEIQIGYAAIVAGLIVRANSEAAQFNFETAENWLLVADGFGVGAEKLAEIRQAIAQRQVDQQTEEVIPATELTLVRYVPPEYPSLAIRRQIEGWVDVEFTVTTVGDTAEIEIVSGDKANYFEKSAILAVEQWRFEPRLFNGQPVDQRVNFRLDYRLDN